MRLLLLVILLVYAPIFGVPYGLWLLLAWADRAKTPDWLRWNGHIY